jgi:hypothetical protein
MTHDLTELDAHEQPSDKLRAVWKSVSKAEQAALTQGTQIDDPRDSGFLAQLGHIGVIRRDQVLEAHRHLLGSEAVDVESVEDAPIYYHPILPGI